MAATALVERSCTSNLSAFWTCFHRIYAYVSGKLRTFTLVKDFAAIDFETANGSPTSVCAVGIVVVRDGRVSDSLYRLIHPAPDYYSYFCTAVHGLTHADTCTAPDFPDVWTEVEPLVKGLTLVAHNARFDEGCLRAAFRLYGMSYPDYLFRDTLAASRRHFGHQLPNHQLQTVAAACGYTLERHHYALADAEACAAIALRLL